MKQTKKGFVEMPATTLNALKNMLFTQDTQGVDLSNLIQDLTPNAELKDLTAINIALAYKGVQVQIDERPHYVHEWKREFTRFDYCGYSLILGVVKVHRTTCELLEDGTVREIRTKSSDECLGFDLWEEMTTDLSDIVKKIEERTK